MRRRARLGVWGVWGGGLRLRLRAARSVQHGVWHIDSDAIRRGPLALIGCQGSQCPIVLREDGRHPPQDGRLRGRVVVLLIVGNKNPVAINDKHEHREKRA